MELCSPKIEKVLIFSQKKLFLYFGKRNFSKKVFRARKIKKTLPEEISYILRNGTFLCFLRKVFHIFWETELFS